MKANVKRAIAQITARRPDGTSLSGTAFLVSERHALTAFHVVGNRLQSQRSQTPLLYSEVSLVFETAALPPISAVPLTDCCDPLSDWALLELQEVPRDVAPLGLGTLRDGMLVDESTQTAFETWGFPTIATDVTRAGVTIDGRVQDVASEYQGAYAYQLYSDNVAAALGDPLNGLSGAPCIVDGVAVGIIRSNLISLDNASVTDGRLHVAAGILYACPIDSDSIQERCRAYLRTLDPIRGLPGLPARDLPSVPFRYLRWYGQEHAEVFFGRGRKIKELYEKVTEEGTPSVTLVYGTSGVGKSSLLAAGLEPRLSWIYQVRAHRFDTTSDVKTLIEHLLEPKAGVSNSSAKPTIVILDQIEVLFIGLIASGDSELATLASFIRSQTTGQHRPRIKFVLGFRSEWLANVRSRLSDSGISYNELHLERMSRGEITEVVRGIESTKRLRTFYGVTVDEGLLDRVASDLLADPHSPVSPLLSILMTRLWHDAKTSLGSEQHLSLDTYTSQMRDRLSLRTFLEEQIHQVAIARPAEEQLGLVNDVLYRHTTSDGTAREVSANEINKLYSHLVSTGNSSGGYIESVLDVLTSQSLLFDLPPMGGTNTVSVTRVTRLAHDTLAPLVREKYHSSEKVGQRAERLLQMGVQQWRRDGSSDGLLDQAELDAVKRGARGMRDTTATERELLQASANQSARNRTRQRILKIAGMSASALIVVLAIVTAFLFQRTRSFKQTATDYIAVATEETATNLTRLGILKLSSSPAESVNFALVAHSLRPTPDAVDLLTRAVNRVPEWSRLGVNELDCSEASLFTSDSGGLFAADAAISLVVVQRSVIPEAVEPVPGTVVTLRRVPDGSVLAMRAKKPGEHSIGTLFSQGDLFAVARTAAESQLFDVYGLTPSSFEKPLVSLAGRQIALSGGHWPLFALLQDGTVTSLDANGTKQTIGKWPQASALYAHPSGRAIVLIEPGMLRWIDLSDGPSQLRIKVIEWPGLEGQVSSPRNFKGWSDLRWTKAPNRFLVVNVNSGQPAKGTKATDRPPTTDRGVVVSAVDVVVGRHITLFETTNPDSGLSKPIFETNEVGDMVAVTSGNSPGRDVAIRVLRLKWGAEGSQRFAEVVSGTELQETFMPEKLGVGDRTFPSAVAFSPNGNYVVIAFNVISHDFYGIGQLASWALNGTGPSEAVPLAVGSVRGAYETPTAATCPISKLAYSKDSSTILAMGVDATPHLLRVQSEPAEPHDGTRIPKEWRARLTRPSVEATGPYNRYQVVKYGDGDVHYLDFWEKYEANISKVVAGPIIAAHPLGTDGTLIIVTDREILTFRRGAINNRVTTPAKIVAVQWGPEVISLFSDDTAFLYSPSMQLLGHFAEGEKEKRLRSALLSVDTSPVKVGRDDDFYFRGDWVSAGTNSLRCVLTNNNHLMSWDLTFVPSSGTFTATLGRLDIPATALGAEQGYQSIWWDPASQTVFWARGSYRGRTDLRQFDSTTGEEVERFVRPMQGWPELIAEVVGAFSTDGKSVLLLRYWPDKSKPRDHYGAAVWTHGASEPPEWNALGDAEYRGVHSIEVVGGQDIAHLLLRRPDRSTGTALTASLQLIRVSDATVISEVAIPPRDMSDILPVIQREGKKYRFVDDEWFRKVNEEVAMRGPDYWANEIVLPALVPDQRKLIESLRTANSIR